MRNTPGRNRSCRQAAEREDEGKGEDAYVVVLRAGVDGFGWPDLASLLTFVGSGNVVAG